MSVNSRLCWCIPYQAYMQIVNPKCIFFSLLFPLKDSGVCKISCRWKVGNLSLNLATTKSAPPISNLIFGPICHPKRRSANQARFTIRAALYNAAADTANAINAHFHPFYSTVIGWAEPHFAKVLVKFYPWFKYLYNHIRGNLLWSVFEVFSWNVSQHEVWNWTTVHRYSTAFFPFVHHHSCSRCTAPLPLDLFLEISWLCSVKYLIQKQRIYTSVGIAVWYQVSIERPLRLLAQVWRGVAEW